MLDNDTKAAISQMRDSDAIWILKDADGCVMLTSEDEDGVPIWSSKSLAKAWASEEWSACEAISIDIETWIRKWTLGLIQDHLMIRINPSEFEEEGVVIAPEEFADSL